MVPRHASDTHVHPLPHRLVWVVVLAITVCSACAHAPTTEAEPAGPLERCSIGSDGITTPKQAKCVARTLGLEPGVRPWKVELQNQAEGGESVWQVCSTSRVRPAGVDPTGFCWYIRSRDGLVLSKAPWWRIRVVSAPPTEFDGPSNHGSQPTVGAPSIRASCSIRALRAACG